MSSDQNPLDIAKQAEQDLKSYEAKVGRNTTDSTNESGVNDDVSNRFPGSTVQYGSSASGGGDNRTIPLSEGGEVNPVTGKMTKARDFEGEGGPFEKAQQYANDNPGADDVRSNIRDTSTAALSGGGGHVPNVGATGSGKGTDVQ